MTATSLVRGRYEAHCKCQLRQGFSCHAAPSRGRELAVIQADRDGRDPVLIRHFSAHNLRHTFCTRYCEVEKNIKAIQEIMGHADIETTMNIYAEATKEVKKQSFANLEGKIKIS